MLELIIEWPHSYSFFEKAITTEKELASILSSKPFWQEVTAGLDRFKPLCEITLERLSRIELLTTRVASYDHLSGLSVSKR